MIVDVSYPNLEGEKLLANLNQEKINTPIIVINQYGNENMIEGWGSNFSTLAAPFEPAELIRSIKMAIRKNGKQKITINSIKQEEKH